MNNYKLYNVSEFRPNSPLNLTTLFFLQAFLFLIFDSFFSLDSDENSFALLTLVIKNLAKSGLNRPSVCKQKNEILTPSKMNDISQNEIIVLLRNLYRTLFIDDAIEVRPTRKHEWINV